jgi:hypothetical protein
MCSPSRSLSSLHLLLIGTVFPHGASNWDQAGKRVSSFSLGAKWKQRPRAKESIGCLIVLKGASGTCGHENLATLIWDHVDSLMSMPDHVPCLTECCNVLRSQRYQSGVKRCGRVHYLPLYPAHDSTAPGFLQCVRNSVLEAQPPPFSPRRIPPCLRQPWTRSHQVRLTQCVLSRLLPVAHRLP